MTDAPRFQTRKRTWSHDDFSNLIVRITRRLDDISAHRPVALVTASTPESAAALLAARERGHPILLLSHGIVPHSFRTLIDLVRPAVILAHGTSRWIEQFPNCSFVSDPETWVVGDADHSEPDIRFELPSNTSILQLTSGSLGPARLALRTREGVADEIRALQARLLFEGERILCASSLAHSYGLIGGLLAPAESNASTIALAGSAVDACALTINLRPTMVIGLASTYQAFLDADLPADALASARVLLCAGAPLPTGLFQAFEHRYGLAIRQDYGTTEAGTISIDYPGMADPDTVGHPLSHLQMRVSRDTKDPVDDDEAGEIQVRGTAVAGGVLDSTGIHAATDEAGWYHTGDVGRLRDDGTIRVERRLRHPVVIDGITVRPEKIEQTIARMPGVEDVAVLPLDDDRGAAIRAVVVASGISARDVEYWCVTQLPAGNVPRIIDIRSALPRSPAGKILYTKL